MDKQFLALCGILLACGASFWGGREYQKATGPNVVVQAAQTRSAPAPQPVRAPRKISMEFAFLPGQSDNLSNKEFSKVEIHSEYPIRVLSGSCHQDYTVEFVCDGPPADIFITDVRPVPVFTQVKANTIKLLMIE